MGMEECIEDLFVSAVAQSDRIELVGVHKLVEDVGTQHHRFRDHGRCREVFVSGEHSVDEGKATSFASQRSVADAGEVAVLVEAFALEHSHYAVVLHLSVCHNGIEGDLAMGIDVLERVPSDVLQEL